MTHEMTNTPPVYVARAGAIRASVWENAANNLTKHKITLTRLYRKNSGWQRGRTFYSDELAAVTEVIAKAQRWIAFRQHQLEPTTERQ